MAYSMWLRTAYWAGLSLAALAVLSACGGSDRPVGFGEPAIVYSTGGKLDKSFNQAAYDGMEKWKKESGRSYLEVEVASESQFEPALRSLAERGATPIIGMGFSQAAAVEKLAKEFPQRHFAIIDAVVDLPNVQSVVFKEQEGSFLVGAMAAIASKTGKVGFVGGMDIPLIRKIQCGYAQGAKYANPQVQVLADITGTTDAAWNNPTRGGELAKAQFAQGVDVVFAAAGTTGMGVYQAAKDSGQLAIGVDSNQNYLQPGTMLTSMVKSVDVVVYNAAKSFKSGTSVLGLKEGGVGYALDAYNAPLVTPQMQQQVEAAKADIISGKIKVADYTLDNACAY